MSTSSDYTTSRAIEIVNAVTACSGHDHAVRLVARLIDGGFVPRSEAVQATSSMVLNVLKESAT